VHRHTRIDPWFLHNIAEIVEMEHRLKALQDPEARKHDEEATRDLLLQAKQFGFSDRQLAFLWRLNEDGVRRLRQQWGIVPSYKRVDTCAAEFEAYPPYYYSTYEAPIRLSVAQSLSPSVHPSQSPPVDGTGGPRDWATERQRDWETTVEDETRPPTGK